MQTGNINLLGNLYYNQTVDNQNQLITPPIQPVANDTPAQPLAITPPTNTQPVPPVIPQAPSANIPTPSVQTPLPTPPATLNFSNQKSFDISEALSFGWKMTFKHFGSFIKISTPYIIVLIVFVLIGSLVGKESQFGLSAIISIVSYLFSLLTLSSFMVLSLMIVDQKMVGGKGVSMFAGKNVMFALFVASLIYTFKILLWSLLLYIPGVYKSIKHYFSVWVAVDNQSYKGAYQKSADLTNGVKLKLVWFMFLIGLINIGGGLALGFGMLITIPLSYLALAYIYRKLSGKSNIVAPVPIQNTASAPQNPVV